jgi:hypothetical protein
MTDEERRKLCAALRRKGLNDRAALCYAAAEEIERLAEDKRQALNVCERALDKLRSCYQFGNTQSDARLIEAGQGSLVSQPSSESEIAVEWRSNPAMRARIRELARPDRDDYDRAVIAVLDDFENMLGKPLL